MNILGDLLMDYKKIYKVEIAPSISADRELTLSAVNYKDGELYEAESIKYSLFFDNLLTITHVSDHDKVFSLFNAEDLYNKIMLKDKIGDILLMNFNDTCFEPTLVESLYSGNNCYIIFKSATIKEKLLNDAVKTIYKLYIKILKVDIISDTYEEIKLSEPMYNKSFSGSVKNFATNGVFYQDIKDFLEFTDLDNMKNYFKDNNSKKIIFRYRRRCIDGGIRWVALEVFPCEEFTEDNQKILIYIKDIHDDYTYQIKEQRKMQYLSTHDNETGLKNNLAFTDDIESGKECIIVIIKFRLSYGGNAIKFSSDINDILAAETHNHNIYRISNKDFIILFEDNSLSYTECRTIFDNMKEKLSQYGLIGEYINSNNNKNINELLFEVDQDMYDGLNEEY